MPVPGGSRCLLPPAAPSDAERLASSAASPSLRRSCDGHNDAGRSVCVRGISARWIPGRPSHGGGVSAVLTCLCFQSGSPCLSVSCAPRAAERGLWFLGARPPAAPARPLTAPARPRVPLPLPASPPFGRAGHVLQGIGERKGTCREKRLCHTKFLAISGRTGGQRRAGQSPGDPAGCPLPAEPQGVPSSACARPAHSYTPTPAPLQSLTVHSELAEQF